MDRTLQAFPVDVRTGWIDFSPSLHWHVTRTIISALGAFASRIRSVAVRITDHQPQNGTGRRCSIDVELKSGGRISSVAAGRDLYTPVHDAARAAAAQLRGHAESGAAASLLQTA
jgi:hypothetical protein